MESLRRTPEELRKHAAVWWPDYLIASEQQSSIIPLLLSTQDEFLSILTLARSGPTHIFTVLQASALKPALFLKHLSVLTDFGGEQIQRLNRNFATVFPHKVASQGGFRFSFTYHWQGSDYTHVFTEMPIRSTMNNARAGIDPPSIVGPPIPLTALQRDLAMVLLHGSAAMDAVQTDILSKCDVGLFLGDRAKLEQYVKQKYIWVSRITGGARANALGQQAQHFVYNFLLAALGKAYTVHSNGTIAGITQNDGRTLTNFDVVVTHGAMSVAIEVTFQVTTNSTIERKAGQARDRHNLLSAAGHKIAYVVDGAGNFQRSSALSTICANSDCTVAFSQSELALLVEFVKASLQ